MKLLLNLSLECSNQICSFSKECLLIKFGIKLFFPFSVTQQQMMTLIMWKKQDRNQLPRLQMADLKGLREGKLTNDNSFRCI